MTRAQIAGKLSLYLRLDIDFAPTRRHIRPALFRIAGFTHA
jgi:hypothetical protein